MYVLLLDLNFVSAEKIKTIHHSTLCPNDMNQTLISWSSINSKIKNPNFQEWFDELEQVLKVLITHCTLLFLTWAWLVFTKSNPIGEKFVKIQNIFFRIIVRSNELNCQLFYFETYNFKAF